MTGSVSANNVDGLELFFGRFPLIASKAMSIAINEAARDVALPAARRDITAQVRFPFGYLDDGDRLSISQFATPTRLEARVTGRDRATSLNRFVTGDLPAEGLFRKGVTVSVKPGTTEKIPGAFRIGLNAGKTMGGNSGLAIRLLPGQTVRNIRQYQPIQIFPNVFLLYAVSVQQAFESVSIDIEPEVTAYLEVEFVRQFNLRVNGQILD